jgi:hypothetical protein
MVPGELAFVTIELENETTANQAFRVLIDDPDKNMFRESREEVRMVRTDTEIEYWAKKKKSLVDLPSRAGILNGSDQLLLSPGDKMQILLICQTFRDIVNDAKEATEDTIVQRYVRIGVECKSNSQLNKKIELNLVPVLPPLDHTFRYYEPENSYFRLKIPPFLQLIEPGLTVRCSKQLATVGIDEKTAELTV